MSVEDGDAINQLNAVKFEEGGNDKDMDVDLEVNGTPKKRKSTG